MINDWEEPETWQAGDTLNADTWNRRIHDPISLMLRRPLMVARRTTDMTVAASYGYQVIGFDTIDIDDDSMAVGDSPYDTFVAQRSGAYHLWFSAPFIANGASGHPTLVRAQVNGIDVYWRTSGVVGAGSTMDHWRAASGEVSVFAGDVIKILAGNYTTSTITVKAQFNAPRVAIMWKRPLS